VIVTIYIDESGTHGSPVVILGGWVGRLGQWVPFDRKWNRLLKQNGLTYFHSKEMRHSENEFAGWSLPKKRAFMAEAGALAIKNLSFGFSISLHLADFKKFYIGQERLKGVAIDSPYGICFRHCVGIVPKLAIDRFKDRALDINFVLESGHPNLPNAEAIFHEVKAFKEPTAEVAQIMETLNTITRGDKKKFPGLQAADVNAYSAFQYETRDNDLELISLPNDSTIDEARKIQKVPIFHLPMTSDVLTQYREFILQTLEGRRLRREATIARRAERGGQDA